MERRPSVTMSSPRPRLRLGPPQSLGRVVPINQGQTKVFQEPQGVEPGGPFSTQVSASRVHKSCCLFMRICSSFLLKQSSGAHPGVADAWPITLTLQASGHPGSPLLRGTEMAWDGLTDEFGFSSKVGSSFLVLPVPGLCVSNSCFHFI